MGAVYLRPLDEAIEKTGFFYARYMDDWIVLCSDSVETEKVDAHHQPYAKSVEGLAASRQDVHWPCEDGVCHLIKE